jgi:uncharacterized membrane protein YeaQ/YmgE (transglycosylase-associated protein family)
MLNVFFWLLFGVLGGWTVALIAQPEAIPKRATSSSIFGALGGMVGGVLTQYISHQPIISGFNGPSLLVAVVVAVVFAVVCNFIKSRRQLKG